MARSFVATVVPGVLCGAALDNNDGRCFEIAVSFFAVIFTPEEPIMLKKENTIRKARPEEFEKIGQLMVQVYSQLEGFPKPGEQPAYYQLLANIGALTEKPGVSLLVATSPDEKIQGAVVYFSDMQYYGSGGSATQEKNAAGFRLLAVDPSSRGKGIGKLLTLECIRRAKEDGVSQLIIHSTMAMQVAWKMYEGLGFQRSEDLDFSQGGLPVYGFRLMLKESHGPSS